MKRRGYKQLVTFILGILLLLQTLSWGNISNIQIVKKAKAAGNTFWVDGSVGVSGDGTELSPWKTIIEAEANAGVTNGDTVHVETGTYVEASTIGGTGNINFAKGITWIADGGNVTIRANSGGAVINSAAATVSGSTTASWGDSTYGFIFDSETSTRGNALNLSAASNKTFTNCQFLYGGYRGVVFIQGANSNILITESTLVNNASANPLIYYYFNATGSVNFTNNTYTAVSKGILDTHASNAANAIFSGGTFNYSGDAVGVLIVNWISSGSLTFDNGDFNLSDRANYFIYLAGAAYTGKITFTNNDVSGNMNLAGSAYIYATQRNDTIWVNNNVFNLTHATASGSLIRLHDNLNIQVKDNDITTESTALTSILIANNVNTSMGIATVSGNTIRTKNKSGYGIAIGNEGTDVNKTAGMLDGSIVENNILYGPAYYDPAITGLTIHGIYMGHNKGFVRNNYINGSDYGFVIKGKEYDWTNASGYGIYSNIVIDCMRDGILIKGAQNVPLFNNTFYLANNPDFSLTNWQGMISVAKNDDGGTYGADGATIYNNILVARSTLDLVKVDSDSVVGFNADNNVYWVNSGATPQFQWSGSVKSGATALADWKTASGEGVSSVFEDPVFFDQDNDDFHLMATSPAVHAGTGTVAGIDVTALDDYEGTQFATPNPSIGALEADSTAPTNQDTVFPTSTVRQGGQAVTIVSSGDATNNVWFAPEGTTTFTEGATMTKAANGTAVSILAPANEGDYKLFVIDKYGNVSNPSVATLTVDNTGPTGTVTIEETITTDAIISLILNATDVSSSVTNMRFSNDGASWSSWEAYGTSKSWNLVTGEGGSTTQGSRTVYAQFRDSLGNISVSATDTVIYDISPVYDNIPGTTQPISVTEGQTITSNPYIIQVKPDSTVGISKVEFLVDDALICTETVADANGVYSCSWDTSRYHSSIRIIAYDIYGVTTTIAREVTVDPTVYTTVLPQTGKR